jgi:hypothetical protein
LRLASETGMERKKISCRLGQLGQLTADCFLSFHAGFGRSNFI